jgi:NAD(P)-dependent dehydrogenase (short-subunit alcohol dehydrogenase family)
VGACDLSFASWRLANQPGISTYAFDNASWDATGIAIAEACLALDGCDGLVLNAGIVDTIHRSWTFGRADWERDIGLNLTGAFRAAQAAFPYLERSGNASVVFVSSVAAAIGQPGQVAYSASKAGMIGMMRTLALEWGSKGIRCNAVMPGLVETPKVRQLPSSVRESYIAQIPIARFGEPAELAATIAFLLSDGAAYINGTTLRVDGGLGLNMNALTDSAGRSS